MHRALEEQGEVSTMLDCMVFVGRELEVPAEVHETRTLSPERPKGWAPQRFSASKQHWRHYWLLLMRLALLRPDYSVLVPKNRLPAATVGVSRQGVVNLISSEFSHALNVKGISNDILCTNTCHTEYRVSSRKWPGMQQYNSGDETPTHIRHSSIAFQILYTPSI